MTILSLVCNQCGAPLEVPESTRFLTCQFCGARLEVQRSGSAVYTEVLQAIDQRTASIADDLQAIRRQNEIEQLDREWDREREGYLVQRKDGVSHVPTKAGSIVGVAIGLVFGLFWIGMAMSMRAPAVFPIFGIIFLFVLLYGSYSQLQKAQAYERREAEYQRRRSELQNGG